MPTRQVLLTLAAAQEAVPETAAATLRTTRQTRALLMTARQKTVRQRAETAAAQIQKLRQKSRKAARQAAVLTASRRITAPLIQTQRTEIQILEMMEIQETPKIMVLILTAAMTIMETLTAETQETAEIPVPAAAQKAAMTRAVPLIRETAPTRAIPTRAVLIPAAAAATPETAEIPEAAIPAAVPTRAVLIPTARSFPNPA
ncbi:MAG: hypothetical protein KH549_08770 [Clostridium sp.]|nr:hypothetical protein [Clostridium sp.]